MLTQVIHLDVSDRKRVLESVLRWRSTYRCPSCTHCGRKLAASRFWILFILGNFCNGYSPCNIYPTTSRFWTNNYSGCAYIVQSKSWSLQPLTAHSESSNWTVETWYFLPHSATKTCDTFQGLVSTLSGSNNEPLNKELRSLFPNYSENTFMQITNFSKDRYSDQHQLQTCRNSVKTAWN